MPSLRKPKRYNKNTMRLKKSSNKSKKMRGGVFNMCKKYKDELKALQSEYKGYIEWVNSQIQIESDGVVSLKGQNESIGTNLYPTLASIDSGTSQTYSTMKPYPLSGSLKKGSDLLIKRYQASPNQLPAQQSFSRNKSLTKPSNKFPVDINKKNFELRKINNSSKNSMTKASKSMRSNMSARRRLSEINNSSNKSLTRPPNRFSKSTSARRRILSEMNKQ